MLRRSQTKKICVTLISCDSAMNCDEVLWEFPAVAHSLMGAREYPRFLRRRMPTLGWRLITI